MSNVTSHSLARELLNEPDGFITISTEDGEYTIGNIKTCLSSEGIVREFKIAKQKAGDVD